MRLLEVNGVSLLGATHNEAVNALRSATNAPLHLVVCYGYTRPEKITVRSLFYYLYFKTFVFSYKSTQYRCFCGVLFVCLAIISILYNTKD